MSFNTNILCEIKCMVHQLAIRNKKIIQKPRPEDTNALSYLYHVYSTKQTNVSDPSYSLSIVWRFPIFPIMWVICPLLCLSDRSLMAQYSLVGYSARPEMRQYSSVISGTGYTYLQYLPHARTASVIHLLVWICMDQTWGVIETCLRLGPLVHAPSKLRTLTQFRFNVGPEAQTLAQQ